MATTNTTASPENLAKCLQQSLSPNASERKQAEQLLEAMETTPHFVAPLLQLVNNQQVDTNVRFAAALYFKNYIKRRWPQSEEIEDTILEKDRQAVKSEIVGLMISVPKQLQLQIGEAVSVIAENDFPESWPELIKELVSKLSPTDIEVNNGILQTAHTVFREWRSAFRSDRLFAKINYVLGQFTEPYMRVFVATDELIDKNANNRQELKVLLHSLNLLCQIFYDLNCQDLPPFFEDNMEQFMKTFHKYLVYSNPNATSSDDNDEVAGDLEEVKASICEIIELYAQRFEEVFPQLPQFVETVWSMLTTVGNEHKYDGVVSKGMGFLRTVVRNPRQRDLFSSSDSLSMICERIIIPNMVLPEADEELFEDDPIQFVRRDVEGNETGSRRAAAADLVRGLLDQFSVETTQAMSKYIQQGLSQYASGGGAQNGWRNKDAALFMVTSVAVIASVGSLGATKVNKLVDITDFFRTQIVQHLQDVSSDSEAPILKVDAIKYVNIFRSQLPREVLVQILPMLSQHLAHPNPVIATFAAIAIERFLVLKSNGALVFGPNDIQEIAGSIMGQIFERLEAADSPQKLAENDYLMKTVMRVILASRTNITPVAPAALGKLTAILGEVSKNPSNPKFNHFMFESIAALARFSCMADRQNNAGAGGTLSQFENALFPMFQEILQQDVSEFMPYVFQILAQLLSENKSTQKQQGLPPAYVALLPPLLQPVLWESQGNIPALVMLLQSYLEVGAAQLARENQLAAILGIFQKLIASRANDHHGFNLLLAITHFTPTEYIKQYLKPVLTLCLNRVQSSKTDKFVRNLVCYIGSILCINDAQQQGAGVALFLDTLDSIQPNLLTGLMQGVILPAIPSVVGRIECKATAIGLARLVASPQFLQNPEYVQLAPEILRQIAVLLMDPKVKETKSIADRTVIDGSAATAAAISMDEDFDSLEIEDTGYQASFAKLATLGEIKIDPCLSINDPAVGVGLALKQASADQARIAQIVQQIQDANARAFIESCVTRA